MRIGFDIGFEKVTVSVFRQGVPRVVANFPSVAAHKNDVSECLFGMAARNYEDETDFTYISSLRDAIFGDGDKADATFLLFLEKLFAYVLNVIARHGKTEVEGVTMVLPQSSVQSRTLQDAIVSAWQKNKVNEVLLISDVTAIVLSYTALSLDRKALFKADGGTAHLVVCNAGYEYFHMDIFEVIHNNYVGKFERCDNISWNLDFMQQIRKFLHKLVKAKLEDSIVSKLPDHIIDQLNEEIDRQITGFDEAKTDRVTIRIPYKNLLTVITRDDYNAVIKPVITKIEELIIASTALINAGEASTGESCPSGNVEVLLVGKNSRLLPLRELLETIQKPLNTRVTSYVDDAESFGAAIASCLMALSTGVNKAQMANRLRQGVLFDMQAILRALLPADIQEALLPTDVKHAQMEADETPSQTEAQGELLRAELKDMPMGTEPTTQIKEGISLTEMKETPSPTQEIVTRLTPTVDQQGVLPAAKGQVVANIPAGTAVHINERQSIVVVGTLCFGYPAAPYCDTVFELGLSTKTTRNRTFHFIQLVLEKNGERKAFMRVLLGMRTRLGLEITTSGTPYLRILTTYNGPTKHVWSELAFFFSERYKDGHIYDKFMAEYGVRFDEMLSSFPEMLTDNSWQITQHGKSLAFIGLMPEILNNKGAVPDRPNRYKPSIITLCKPTGQRTTLIVQQCQEISENGHVQERECSMNDILNCIQLDGCMQKVQLQHPCNGITDIVLPTDKLCPWFIKQLKNEP